jgi:prevent-host-death family protein
METWQLQDAKNNFNQLVDKAISGNPQLVTMLGQPAVVIMSVDNYNSSHLKPSNTKSQNFTAQENKEFVDFLLSIPKSDDDEDLFTRIQGQHRDIDL